MAIVRQRPAPELIGKGKAVAARILGTTADEVAFADGRFATPRSNRSFDFLALAQEAARLGVEGELAVVIDNEMHDPVFPNGCAVCEAEVDPETGWVDITRYTVVDDVGRCINPLIVHGQTHGGAAQGVGEAMWEEYALDPASGQPLCGSFMDYGMPRSDNLPSFTTEIVEVLSPTNPFGIKAGGEGGCTPALAVVVSAILDALAPLGVRDIKCLPHPSRCGRQSATPKPLTRRVLRRPHRAAASRMFNEAISPMGCRRIASSQSGPQINLFPALWQVTNLTGV
jgi:carbon-monoxide dehydrogenase large subunit